MGRIQQGIETEVASVFDAGRAGKMPMAMPGQPAVTAGWIRGA